MKKLFILFALSLASFAAHASEGDDAAEFVEGPATEEFDAAYDAQAMPWWFLGCVNSVGHCHHLAWSNGFHRFIVRRDFYRCPPYLAACWARRF